MNELIKVRDMSVKYDVSARALKYYEDMGLLTSTRGEDYAYRMYDEEAVKRLEQILILRKLNISVKDIKRIFDTAGSDAVLEVLGKKVSDIDGEVALLHELKEIIMEFIDHIRQADFSKDADVKLLYEKAKEIEGQLVNVDYNGNPGTSKGSRLFEITEKLDKKIPDVMIIRIPGFRAVTSGDQSWDDMFRDGGYMFQLWQHIHLYKNVIFDCFDFLLPKNDKAEWICAVADGAAQADVSPLQIIDFPGGLYAMAVSIDEDDESIHKVQDKINRWIDTTNFELDGSRGVMCNMPYLDEENVHNKDIEIGLGYKQTQRYVPIKLRDDVANRASLAKLSCPSTSLIVDLPDEKCGFAMRVANPDSWAVAFYELGRERKDQKVTITFSADIKRTGAAGRLNWLINNSDYPSVCTPIDNAAENVWHTMGGSWTGTLTDQYPKLLLDTHANNSAETVYHIANFKIDIVNA